MTDDNLPIKIKVPVKGSIESLIKGRFNGMERVYLVRDLEKKGNLLLHIVDRLQKILPGGTKFIFEAKYSMGFRNKRIDIAVWDKKDFLLCKLVGKNSEIDKRAIYLDSIITHIKTHLDIENVIGCIIFKEIFDKNIIMHIEKVLTNRFIFVKLEDIWNSANLCSLSEVNYLK